MAILTFIYVVILLGIYFLPYIIACEKDHPRKGSIGWLNLLLGWTLIGWIGALIWALNY